MSSIVSSKQSVLEDTNFFKSPPKTSKNKLKTLREKDLREWLQHHNRKMHDDSEEQFRHEQIHKHLIDGVSMSQIPEKQFHDNLLFTAPLHNVRSKTRGNKFVTEVHRSARFPNAVRILQKYDKDKRWDSGLNANTLMTEYRRKVILHAFGYEGQAVEEPREVSQEKVKLFMQANYPELIDEQDRMPEGEALAEATREQRQKEVASSQELGRRKREKEEREKLEDFSISGKYDNFIKGSNARIAKGSGSTVTKVRPLKECLADPRANFQPKADDYDVMRNRWRYLKPEIAALSTRQTMAPDSISRQVYSPVSRSTVTGAFTDVLGFEDIQARKAARVLAVKGPHEAKSVMSLSQKFSMTSLDKSAGSPGSAVSSVRSFVA